MQKRGQKVLLVGAVLIVLTVLCFYFDSQLVEAISELKGGFLNDLLLGITLVSSEIIIFFLIPIFFLWQEHKRKWILPIIVTFGISILVGFLLKVGIQRMRPFQQGLVETIPTLVGNSFTTWNFSFPSMQVMMVFAALPILLKEFRKIGYIWIFFAVLVAFSRVYFGLHFMSDVLVGAILGYGLGWLVVDLENRKRFWSRIYEKVFYGER